MANKRSAITSLRSCISVSHADVPEDARAAAAFAVLASFDQHVGQEPGSILVANAGTGLVQRTTSLAGRSLLGLSLGDVHREQLAEPVSEVEVELQLKLGSCD